MKQQAAAEHALAWSAEQAIAQAQRDAVRADRAAARAAKCAARVRSCDCGAVITRRKDGRRCAACSAKRLARIVPRAWKRVLGIDHLCPCCGAWFKGYRHEVYCSARCCELMTKRGIYPALGRIDVEERNHLAELIYLARQANRRLYEISQ